MKEVKTLTYKTIIGLEIHNELLTNTKIFCSCINEFGGEPNTHCCPVCIGLPGALPVMNKKVIEYAIKAGIAFNSEIKTNTKMDRKNYFYADLPKGYQISQDELPICEGGYIEIELEEGSKKIHLERIHIEEDTGKLTHTDNGDTLIDFNRAGVPLVEIVTKPEMNTPEEAHLFLESLRSTLKYIGVSDGKMEKGTLRCDVNINVVNEKTGKKSNITEIKNLNSFRAAVKASEYEVKRHIALLEEGKDTVKDTRRWDEVKGETISMREKGGVADYRYAADGDFAPIQIEDSWVSEIRANLPELPHDKKERFIKEYNLSAYDAGVLTASKDLALFFEETIKHNNDINLVSNWVMGDVLRRLNEEEIEIQDASITPKSLSDLIDLVKSKEINNNTGKKVLREMFDSGKDPNTIVKEKGLIQISDEGALKEMVKKVLDDNEQSILDYKDGKDRAIGFLVGQVMKASRGKANPQMVNKMIVDQIKER